MFPPTSFNFAGLVFPLVSLAAAPLAVIVSFLLLYIVTHPRFSRSPLHSKRPLTLTQHNTLLNRHENGGTGVWSRKWRRKVATALAMAPLRRGLGDTDDDYEDGEGESDDPESSSSGSQFWKVKIRPGPVGLKGCLKREGSFEVTRKIQVEGGSRDHTSDTTAGRGETSTSASCTAPSTTENLSPIPSPRLSLISSDSDDSFYSPLIPPPSSPPNSELVPPTPSETKQAKKAVTIEEPSLAELEALRTLWDSPEMQSTVNGGNGLGGIAGYRRTRDFYARGQGGRGVSKAAASSSQGAVDAQISRASVPIHNKTETVPKHQREPSKFGDEEDNGSPRPRRPLNSALTRASSSSLSPAPVSRYPLSKRALSPSSSAGIVFTSSSTMRRRGLSPNALPLTSASGVNPSRNSSISPGPPSDRTHPRWIKTKKTPSPNSRSSSVSARFARRKDGAVEESEDEGRTGRDGTISATVSDDEDGFEDLPPTPPAQPSLALAMAPLAHARPDQVSQSPSSMSPSLGLLLEHTNRTHDLEDQIKGTWESDAGSHNASPSFAPIPLDMSASHLPTPSPSPTLDPQSEIDTPSVSITPASPDIPLASLPPISPKLHSN